MSTKQPSGVQRHGQVPGTQEAPRAATPPGRASNRDLYRAAVTGLAPSVLLIRLVHHPHLDDLRDKGALAAR